MANTLTGVARKHPQSAYSGLQKSLQQDWSFVQRVALDIGDAFRPVEQALREVFIQSLFQGLIEVIPGRGVIHLPMKQAGLAFPDPTKTAAEKWMEYCVITGHLVADLRGQEEFRTSYHATYMREGREEARKRNTLRSDEALEETLEGAPVHVACRLWWAKKTGAWLTVQPSTVNGTGLGAQEWRDALLL